MNDIVGNTAIEELATSEQNEEINVAELNDDVLLELHPQLANIIKTIQAEKLGDEAIAWTDFSQHSKY